MEEVVDTGPRVALRRYFGQPYDGAVAAARTCYSDHVIYADEITPVLWRDVNIHLMRFRDIERYRILQIAQQIRLERLNQ